MTTGLGFSGALRATLVCSIVAVVLIACGSSGDQSNFVDGKEQSASPTLPGELGGGPDSGGAELCKKLTCQDQGIECGPAGDGCGGIIADCGTCPTGKRCGGPNALSKCVDPVVGTACAPKTCQQLGVECGQAGDGCGGILTCGTCPSGQQCGSTASPSKCVAAVAMGPDGGACVPKTKAEYNTEGKDCGQQSDNCGGIVDLGNCIAPEFCGGGGPSKCAVSGGGACTKKTCADYPGKCGAQSDGCGGVTANCLTCAAPTVCGGGGTASVCGGGTPKGPTGGACVPKSTCGPGQCGMLADGCGGVFDCGNPCVAGTICGGGGTPNACGAPDCKKITACPAGMNCGSIADGCGGTVLCGGGAGCTFPQICGGGGQANVCGGGSVTGDGGTSCSPMTCAMTGKQCGPVADGCGGIVSCPACTSPEICGGGGVPSMCGGANQCTPKTVANCPANGCGWIADGCGGLVQCGTCTGGAICGASTPNVCGTGSGGPCTGFCLNQVTTCGATPTRITGKVFAPNATLPLPGAVVYVPNGASTSPYGVTPITSGVTGGSCDQCNQTASGSPLVSTTSNADGSFTLNNVPAGVSFPIVIQLGKWRRMVMVGPVSACGSLALSASQTRLPTRQNEGQNGVDNIPFMAVSTGQVDGLECVLRKIGIEDTMFGNPPGTAASGTTPSLDRGRIRLYYDEDDPNTYARGGAVMNALTPSTDVKLTDTQTHLDQYDAVIFGCPGDANTRSTAILDRVRGYADKGGRVFATHYNYVYLSTNAPWSSTTAWDTANERSAGNGSAAVWTGEINTGSAKRLLFSQWLNASGVSALTGTSPPRIDITEPRNNADRNVAAGAEEWITRYNDPGPGSTGVLHYTFNTPYGAAAANQCGRVLFSDFHVSIGNTYNQTFPNYCNTNGGALTNQEKVLAFFLFDLTSCIQTAPPPTCTPKTCANYPSTTCGTQSDGCGGTTANCGACTNGQTCGGAGVQNQCGGPTCTKKTCADYGANCGTVPDGCGGTVNCPPCAAGQICGGGGVAYQCGASSCAPKTCTQLGIQCGQSGDGCGNVITCPPCPTGTTCGGGGVPNVCGAPDCTPLATCPAGMNCGDYPNGCGGSIHCGDCAPGQTCGGGGAPNVCGAASCTPNTCAQQGAQCGQVSDGCASVVTCPDCPPGDYCNANNQCVSPTCTPKTCKDLGVECGPVANQCGGLEQCGDCPPGQGCGAGGVPGKCGKIPCAPRTCNDLGAVCGQVADGCGGLTPVCGTCDGNTACSQGQCIPACTPRTCGQANANCGYISDGCGGLVDCGNCAPGETCGYGGTANVCGAGVPK